MIRPRLSLPRLLPGIILAFLLVLQVAPAAHAAEPGYRFITITPDFATAGKRMFILTNVENTGSQALNGNLEISYDLPPELEWQATLLESENLGPGFGCAPSGSSVKCVGDATGNEPGVRFRFKTVVAVSPSASGTLAGSVGISGTALTQPASQAFDVAVGSSGPFAIKNLAVSIADGGTYSADQGAAVPTSIETEVRLVSEARTNFDIGSPNLMTIAPSESFRDVLTHIPPGFVGNPAATSLRCTAAELTTAFPDTSIPQCPSESQVGVLEVGEQGELVPLYNLVPPHGSPAAFGFFFASIVVILKAEVRPGDNGIDIVTEKAPSSIPIPRFSAILWGVPSDPSHDHLRSRCLQGGFGYNKTEGDCSLRSRNGAAFLRNPTSCTGSPLPWSVEVDTYQHVGTFVRKDATSPAIQGCDLIPFNPSLSLAPSSGSASSPSGLDLELSIPQDHGPSGLAQSDLESATVTLPEGMAINSASAGGLDACTDAQLRLGLEGPSSCPDAAKIGSVEVETPLLEEPISGSVFLRSQASQDPASGDLFRLAIELRSDERGLAIKLPGSLRVNSQTGQLSTSFDDLPQLPFETMRLHLKSGPRAPLTTPPTCGTYSAHAVLVGWNGKTETADPSFTIDRDCTTLPFKPGFEAGVTDSTAGEFAPFSLRVTRDSGQPNLSRIDATLPEGELAKLAGVPICSNAQAAAGDCPAASRVGQVVAGIGEGPSPLYLPQAGKAPSSVYLAAPYKGAPYSVLAEVPAQAGPFDLGEVLVRSAVAVDPETARVSVLSDPLPQIFQGVPVSYRDVRVLVDRPEFTLNPTDCRATEVTGRLAAIGGQSAAVSDRFQAADCASLGFKPKLAISLSGKTKRSGNPALKAVLRMPKSGANVARAVVTLPGSEFIAQDHLDTVCTRVQYEAGGGGGAGCPKGSVYGRARAFTPLLDYPLQGPVYLRSNGGERELPDLVASLDGAIHVDLVGYIDSDKRTGGLRTTFARVPDAPVSKFVLKMPGGDKSLLENSTNICRGKHRAKVKMDAQNGRIHNSRPLVRARCGKGARER